MLPYARYYLASFPIAGFVEFPILIKEGNRRTIIIHPIKQLDLEWLRNHVGEDFHIFKLNLSYP